MLGIIHKRRYEYAAAKALFDEALKYFDRGQKFITERTRANILYEIGMMLDGEGHLFDARAKFEEIYENAEKDSYLELDSMYEIARLSLALWLEKPEESRLSDLTRSISTYEVWLSREWNKSPSKLWAYYGELCARKEKIVYMQSKEIQPKRADIDLLKNASERFLAEGRRLIGVKKYELRFSAFILTSKSRENFPGEPLFCNLDDLLQEFKIH